jgi:hypothetical protein
MRHPLRPFRAEGVPPHDAEGFAHNGVYVKDSRHGRREAATGYHLWSVGSWARPGAAAAQVCGAVRAGEGRRWEEPCAGAVHRRGRGRVEGSGQRYLEGSPVPFW